MMRKNQLKYFAKKTLATLLAGTFILVPTSGLCTSHTNNVNASAKTYELPSHFHEISEKQLSNLSVANEFNHYAFYAPKLGTLFYNGMSPRLYHRYHPDTLDSMIFNKETVNDEKGTTNSSINNKIPSYLRGDAGNSNINDYSDKLINAHNLPSTLLSVMTLTKMPQHINEYPSRDGVTFVSENHMMHHPRINSITYNLYNAEEAKDGRKKLTLVPTKVNYNGKHLADKSLTTKLSPQQSLKNAIILTENAPVKGLSNNIYPYPNQVYYSQDNHNTGVFDPNKLPQTGDTNLVVITFITVLIVLGVVVSFKINKKRAKNN